MQMGQSQPGATAILTHPEMHQPMPTQLGNYILIEEHLLKNLGRN